MQLFRHPADRKPIALISLFFLVNVLVYAFVDSPVWLALVVVAGIIPRGGICAYNHHHQHLTVFKQAIPNRLLDLVYGLLTGITSHGWVLHHSLGHHVNYLDQTKDESRWRYLDGTKMGEMPYALIVGGTAYPRMWKVARTRKRHLGLFVSMALLTFAIVAGLVWLRPVPGIIMFVVPMVLMLFHTSWATYSHHSGKKTSSHFVASNNIIHDGYNKLTGNLGYHTAHHYKPGVHWSELPALHAEIAHKIPADCYMTPGIPWNLAQRFVAPPEGMPFAEGTSVDTGDAPDAEPVPAE